MLRGVVELMKMTRYKSIRETHCGRSVLFDFWAGLKMTNRYLSGENHLSETPESCSRFGEDQWICFFSLISTGNITLREKKKE